MKYALHCTVQSTSALHVVHTLHASCCFLVVNTFAPGQTKAVEVYTLTWTQDLLTQQSMQWAP